MIQIQRDLGWIRGFNKWIRCFQTLYMWIMLVFEISTKKKFQNLGRFHDLWAISITLVTALSPLYVSPAGLWDPTNIYWSSSISKIKAWPLMCARVSNHFYDLPVLNSIVYSLLPHLVKSESSSFLSEWRHHHLVSIYLLIAAGHGDHLDPAWYLAFIMHLRFKRGLRKTLSAFSTPPQKFLHDPPSAFTWDQVNPPEKRPSCT